MSCSREGFSLLAGYHWKFRKHAVNWRRKYWIDILTIRFWRSGYVIGDTINDARRLLICSRQGCKVEYSKKYNDNVCVRCFNCFRIVK